MARSGRFGRRFRLASMLVVAAGALVVPLAGAAPAYATQGTDCTVITSGTGYGDPGTISVTVSESGGLGTPTGTVKFTEGSTTLGTATLSDGYANLKALFGDVGSYLVVAIYSGDANYSSASCSGVIIVDPAETSTSVSSSVNPSAPGQPVTFTATVEGSNGDLGGTVDFADGGTTIGTGTVNGVSTASFTTSSLAPGTHQITASYLGDANYDASSSGPLTQTVKADDDLSIAAAAGITVNATGPSGAVVSYTPPAVSDPDDATPPAAACSPAPGSTFPAGATQVTCTATDPDDTNSPVSTSFTVTVNGAATQVSALITLVNGYHLHPAGAQNSFDSQLQAVQADLQAGSTARACSDLTSFANHARAQSGKQLTASQGTQVIADATQIRAVLGC